MKILKYTQRNVVNTERQVFANQVLPNVRVTATRKVPDNRQQRRYPIPYSISLICYHTCVNCGSIHGSKRHRERQQDHQEVAVHVSAHRHTFSPHSVCHRWMQLDGLKQLDTLIAWNCWSPCTMQNHPLSDRSGACSCFSLLLVTSKNGRNCEERVRYDT